MSISPLNWIRDLFGIRKDWIDAKKALADTKKVGLETEKLEDEKSKRGSLITPATLDDVEKYDPKVQKIQRRASRLMIWLVLLFLLLILLSQFIVHTVRLGVD